MNTGRLFLIGLMLTTSAACVAIPDEKVVTGQVTDAFIDLPPVEGAKVDPATYWTGFGDPMLDTLISEARADGLSLKIAAARIREARATGWSSLSVFMPDLSANGTARATRSEEGPLLTGITSDGMGGYTTFDEKDQSLGTITASLSWELPLWGRANASLIGSRANVAGAKEDFRAAESALIGDVSETYLSVRLLQAQIIVLRTARDDRKALAKAIAVRRDAGLASASDAADAARSAADAESRLANAEGRLAAAANRLSVLRGRSVGMDTTIASLLSEPSRPPNFSGHIVTSAPADILRLRPDVRGAEADALRGAAAVGIARTELLPNVNLLGTITSLANIDGSPVSVTSISSGGLAGVTIPLFDFGKRAAGVSSRRAQFSQLVDGYRQTVLAAIADAQTALTTLKAAQISAESARIAADSANIQARGVRALYDSGISDLAEYVRVDALRVEADLAAIDAEANLGRAVIAVYRAFAGGISAPPALRKGPRVE